LFRTGVARLTSVLPSFADQNPGSGPPRRWPSKRLECVSRHVKLSTAVNFPRGAKPERRERWRLRFENHFAEVRRVRDIEPFGFESLISPAPGLPPRRASFALHVEEGEGEEFQFVLPVGCEFPVTTNRAVCSTGSRNITESSLQLHFQIGYHCAENLMIVTFSGI